jgi:predicted transcriptional regulator
MNWTPVNKSRNIYRSKLSDYQVQEIIKIINQNPSIRFKDICKDFKVTRQAISYRLLKNGIRFKKGRVKYGEARKRINTK